ncbi:MAG TPA: ADOP family duplicated permease [Vicinamibacterales bacterium]
MIGQVIRDLRHAARMIFRMPALAAVVIGSLGVGIGANTVVFSWIQAVVFNPIAGVHLASGFHLVEPRTDTGLYVGASWREYRDLRERLRALDGLIAFRMVPLYVGERGRVERSSALLVSGNYFASLALTPALGRFPRADEVDRPGTAPVMVISYDYWRTRFSGAASALGQTLRVNGVDMTIVGVAPRGFRGTILMLTFDFWLPATMAPVLMPGSTELDDRGVRAYTLTGTLAPGAGRAQAQSEVDVAMRQLAQAYPQTNRNVQADVLPFWQSPRGPQKLMATSLAILQLLMVLLLLAVCGNTANLMLARASSRQREMGVRLALGAGRWRIVSLLLVESILLALAGAALGGAIAIWGTTTLSAMPPLRVRGIPVSFETHVDAMSLAFTMALGLACGLIFGLAPALQLARLDPQRTLRAGASTPPRSRLRTTLMALEVALAVVVLLAAGLFLRSFMQTRNEDPGFKREGVLLAAYDLSGRNIDEASTRAFTANLLDRVRALPGIEAAAMATSVPLDIHGLPTRFFELEGRPRTDATQDQALANTVSPGYFAVMGLPMLAGRDFADLRDAAAPPQVVINEAFVRRYLDGGDALGRRVEVRGRKYVIIGVVPTSLYDAFGEPPTPILYFSLRDRPSASTEIHLRARPGFEATAASDLRRVVRELDPELPLYDIRTLSDHIEANLIFRRIPARMFMVLAPLLLLLAAIGIYAVVAYAVTLRTTEIGVRLALGATARRLVGQFVGEHLLVVGLGALAGWLLAFAVVLDILTAPIDPAVFAGVPLILLAVATLASWWPARRVTRVDPMLALKAE